MTDDSTKVNLQVMSENFKKKLNWVKKQNFQTQFLTFKNFIEFLFFYDITINGSKI